MYVHACLGVFVYVSVLVCVRHIWGEWAGQTVKKKPFLNGPDSVRINKFANNCKCKFVNFVC